MNNILDTVSTGKIAILCGAGISRSSGLPTVNDFYNQFFDYLFNQEDKDYIIKLIYEFDIPFEKIIESTLNITGYDRQFFDIFSHGEPNENHYILASLFAKNHINDIYTTNFDCLIEKAIQNNGISFHYSRYVKESDFVNIQRETDKKLIKLHGTTDDLNSIRITLSDLTASKLNKDRVLPIKYLFKDGDHDAIIVLGYSFSDVFDVNPVIEYLKESNKTIIVIEHSSVTRELEELANDKSKNPFNKFACFGKRLPTDTTMFLKLLHKKLTGTDYIQAPIDSATCIFDWKDCFDQWIGKLDVITKKYLSGRLWSVLRHYKNSVCCFSEAYELVLTEQEHPMYVNIADNLVSSLYQSYGNNSINGLVPQEICNDVQEIVRTKRKTFLSVKEYYNENAILKFRMGRLNENNIEDINATLKLYYSAYRLYYKSENAEGIAKVFHQLAKIYGVILHNTEMGLKIQNKNKLLCEERGYISWIARSYSAMGYICQVSPYAKYREKAKYYYSEAAKLLKTGEIDLFVSNSISYAVNCMIDCDYKSAENILENTLKYPVSKLTDAYYAAILYNLAKCRIRLNKPTIALENILEAESIYIDIIKNKYDIVQSKQEKAIILLILGNKTECFELLSQIEDDIHILSADDKGHYYFYRTLYHLVANDLEDEKWNKLAYGAFKDAELLNLYTILCKEFSIIVGIDIPMIM